MTSEADEDYYATLKLSLVLPEMILNSNIKDLH